MHAAVERLNNRSRGNPEALAEHVSGHGPDPRLRVSASNAGILNEAGEQAIGLQALRKCLGVPSPVFIKIPFTLAQGNGGFLRSEGGQLVFGVFHWLSPGSLARP